MDAILEQCPGVIGIHDDMVIFEVDQQDHDANLINLLNVCQKEGLVLNSKKLELWREQVTFFGAEYSAQGMHPDPKKVQGITEMTVPTDKQQLRYGKLHGDCWIIGRQTIAERNVEQTKDVCMYIEEFILVDIWIHCCTSWNWIALEYAVVYIHSQQ